jgi:hypothetical protein
MKGYQLLPFYHCDPSALMMEAAGFSKMVVPIKLHGVILEKNLNHHFLRQKGTLYVSNSQHSRQNENDVFHSTKEN